MKRTPALAAAAAALGLMAGLELEARAGTLQREVSPHTVTVAWLTPGAAFPAGVELDGPGVASAASALSAERMHRLAPMRARVPDHVAGEREARLGVHRRVLAGGRGCPRAHEKAAVELRRT